MKKLLLALGILALICSPAMAGRNANGAMVVHTDNSVIYTPSDFYCNSVMPPECPGLNANATGGLQAEQVIWLVAAFRPEASPGVTTLQFGIEHNLPANQGYFTAYAACGPGAIELQDAGWPQTGFGNLVAYSGPVFSHSFQFYWFAVFVDGPGNFFGTRSYPGTGEAKFVDDGNPPVEDLCTLFGTVRWDGAGGNHCPEPPLVRGACCFPDGHCEVLDPAQCGGVYMGDDTVCNPNPCEQPEACCFQDGRCLFVLPSECALAGGTPDGPGTTCDPNLCDQPPVPEACCFQDGSCQFILAADCTAQGGTPQGAGTTCETVNCQIPTGACCIGDQGNCQILTAPQCADQGGVYQGDGSTCEPVNPCPIVPTENTTWGQIKANYR
jgi:hypothetical protein